MLLSPNFPGLENGTSVLSNVPRLLKTVRILKTAHISQLSLTQNHSDGDSVALQASSPSRPTSWDVGPPASNLLFGENLTWRQTRSNDDLNFAQLHDEP